MDIYKRIITVIICVSTLCLSLMFVFGKKRDFLENENRTPAKFPELTVDSLIDGKFTSELEEYMKDHFPFRDNMMKIKTGSQLFSGYKRIDGTFISDERLFQEVKNPDKTRITKSANKLIDAIDNKNIKSTVILIPSATEIYPEDLPYHSPVIDQSAVIDDILADINCTFPINPTEHLISAKATGNVFYLSDHHWTSHAALSVFIKYCETVGIEHIEYDQYQKQTVTDSFKGTLYSRVPNNKYIDSIDVYSAPDVTFTASYANSAMDELTETEYFVSEKLNDKDKYCYFGGGNPPITVLENTSSASEDEIVIVKDSFANCFAPYLAEHFKKVHIIDPRYYKGKRISEYINENPAVTHLLIMYGLNSLNDNSGVSTMS